ncbi:Thioredoxin reductase [Nitrospira japonica]|uniref:Thioredoxin reductase n=1 Tax=Nitrospira japonica TaxID=1325564 RepID=A0A1W1I0Q3_9BACT|nr:NAD(P)/FAD-dependent oxidoreductase [Nitrospira japonica]SLM46557.1 Thioredoxin reductase [Nitrospira japonica]
MYDVIIIGGSYAGLAAALQLVRARRHVLIVDAGQRRNRFAHGSHGFLGQDGQPPAAIAAKGRSEVLAYPTVTWREALATEARSVSDGFVVRTGSDEHRAKRLILATGVVDELPAISGLADRWGKQVFSCPYCDGYELGMGRLGVLATGVASTRFALLISEWAGVGKTTFFINGAVEPEAEQLAALASRHIEVERGEVVEVAGNEPVLELRLGNGRSSILDGLFLLPHTRLNGPFAEQLGCEVEMGPHGPLYRTDETKETTVAGVFACGDAALTMPSVAFAVADGVRAGKSTHQSLVFGSVKKEETKTQRDSDGALPEPNP